MLYAATARVRMWNGLARPSAAFHERAPIPRGRRSGARRQRPLRRMTAAASCHFLAETAARAAKARDGRARGMRGRRIGRARPPLRSGRRIEANPITEPRQVAERCFHAALTKDPAREACHALQGGLGHRDARPQRVEQFLSCSKPGPDAAREWRGNRRPDGCASSSLPARRRLRIPRSARTRRNDRFPSAAPPCSGTAANDQKKIRPA